MSRIPTASRPEDIEVMRMERVKKEKSILGQINYLSHRLVLMLVFPIIISLVLMLFYAWKYHSAIVRMETITSLKKVVAEDIPGSAWNVVSGQDTIQSSYVYPKIHQVKNTIETITERAGEENRLSLIVAGRTMETLENYVDHVRDNVENQVPVVKNEEILEEIRNVAALVDSMLNEYVAQEITSTARMSLSLGVVIMATAAAELLIVVAAWWFRNRSVKSTAQFVRQPIERLEEVAARLAEGTLDARLPDTDVTELRNLTLQVNTMADRLEEMIHLAATYQLLLRENRRIMLLMAGLPSQVSLLLNHESVSFLRRASQYTMQRLEDYEVEEVFQHMIQDGGKTITPEALDPIIRATEGFPYMMPLVGYRVWSLADNEDSIGPVEAQKGIELAKKDFESRILRATVRELSDRDKLFLKAMMTHIPSVISSDMKWLVPLVGCFVLPNSE